MITIERAIKLQQEVDFIFDHMIVADFTQASLIGLGFCSDDHFRCEPCGLIIET